MCGLVGMAGNVSVHKHAKMFKDMLIFDSVRGSDSTGLAIIGFSKHITVEKKLGGPSNLWDWGSSKALNDKGLLKTSPLAIIGHNRAATVGKITTDNAHPFQCDHIVGAHNGTLYDWTDLEGYKENDVDSKSIFQTIAVKGVEYCWKSFRGAAAITWWDSKEETINLVRNKERPLYICYSEGKDCIFWASESWMISIAAQRNSVSLLKKDKTEFYDIFMLNEDELYSFKPTATSITTIDTKKLEKKIYVCPPTAIYRGPKTLGNSGADKPKNDKTKINLDWAVNTVKGSKELRGIFVTLDYPISTFDGHQYIVGNVLNNNGTKGRRIEIFPKTLGEFNEWRSKCEDKSAIYFLGARPRLGKSRNAAIVVDCISIDCSHVHKANPDEMTIPKKVIKVPQNNTSNVVALPKIVKTPPKKSTEMFYGPDHEEYDRVSWWTMVGYITPNYSCTGCDEALDINDHEKLMWYKHAIICPQCQENAVIMNFLTTQVGA